MSQPAPVRHPGQPSHEVVFALPLRNDGKVWSGTVTFTASKPIEVEILHTYAPEQRNQIHYMVNPITQYCQEIRVLLLLI